jgi:hypothetical protein
MLPVLPLHGHDVYMALQKQRGSIVTTLQPCEQVGTLGVPGEDLRLIATVAKHLVDPLDAPAFVARRVGGVEADESLEQLYRTLVDRSLFVRGR